MAEAFGQYGVSTLKTGSTCFSVAQSANVTERKERNFVLLVAIIFIKAIKRN